MQHHLMHKYSKVTGKGLCFETQQYSRKGLTVQNWHSSQIYPLYLHIETGTQFIDNYVYNFALACPESQNNHVIV